MKFLIDRCAGHRLADWLRDHGHDVREATEVTPDPGDQALLRRAVSEQRILVTIDVDWACRRRAGRLCRQQLLATSIGCGRFVSRDLGRELATTALHAVALRSDGPSSGGR